MIQFFEMPKLSETLDVAFLSFTTIMSVLIGVFDGKVPLLSRTGPLMSYSKFAKDCTNCGLLIPSKIGMILVYFPSMLLGIMISYQDDLFESPVLPSVIETHHPLTKTVALLTAIHFGKRVLECLFLHRFSGTMPLLSSITLTSFYILTVLSLSLFVTTSQINPGLQLMGRVMFVMGCIGKIGNNTTTKNFS